MAGWEGAAEEQFLCRRPGLKNQMLEEVSPADVTAEACPLPAPLAAVAAALYCTLTLSHGVYRVRPGAHHVEPVASGGIQLPPDQLGPGGVG